jgi:hypothetical protein
MAIGTITICAATDARRHQARTQILVLQGELRADQRQHCRIGEMKQHRADGRNRSGPLLTRT